jgi:uncharacterized membrane protein YkoI
MNALRYLFTFFFFTLSMTVFAIHLPDDIEPGDAVNEIQLPLTRESAAELVKLESKGKILSVDKKSNHGKALFRVKVLHDNGKIKIYRLDPNTGHTLH